MSNELDITGTWKRERNYLESDFTFLKDDLCLLIPPPSKGRSKSVLFLFRESDKLEDWVHTVLDTIEGGIESGKKVWTFTFNENTYKLEYFKDKEEIKISREPN